MKLIDTRSKELLFAVAREKEDLRRFELNPEQNTESIATTKRHIEQYEAELALYPPDDLSTSPPGQDS